ncbi:unnamed protein product [Phytomonas sp. EM1]|nr:unnamed protein product [Phytomonas sp. EM1]|eukprot:CCW63100.1 unnamed protein product [Phytomonas sp. isolate EM1]
MQPDGISNNDVLIITFIVVVLSYVFSMYWERRLAGVLFFPNELAMEKEISNLEKQAAGLNTTDTWHEFARVERKLLILRKKLSEERSQRRDHQLKPATLFSYIMRSSWRSPLTDTEKDRKKTAEVRSDGWLCKVISKWFPNLTSQHLRSTLPGVISYVIRYGPVGGLCWKWWGRPHVGQLPMCLAMKAFTQMFCLPAVIFSFLKHGVLYAIWGAHSMNDKLASSVGEKNDLIHEPPVSFGIFIWVMMCVCTVKFTLRVLC